MIKKLDLNRATLEMGLLKAQPCDVWCFWYTMRDTRFEDTVKFVDQGTLVLRVRFLRMSIDLASTVALLLLKVERLRGI